MKKETAVKKFGVIRLRRKPAKPRELPGKSEEPPESPPESPTKSPPKSPPKIPVKTTSSADPELVSMLRKLADWEPSSDHAVLEAGNRLVQAAMEKLFPYGKVAGQAALYDAVAACMPLKGHFLTRDNGVGVDHDYVLDVGQREGNVELSTVHIFRRNRIAEWAVSLRTIRVAPDEVAIDRSRVLRGIGRKPSRVIPGMSVDSREASEDFRSVVPIVDALSRMATSMDRPAQRKFRKRPGKADGT